MRQRPAIMPMRAPNALEDCSCGAIAFSTELALIRLIAPGEAHAATAELTLRSAQIIRIHGVWESVPGRRLWDAVTSSSALTHGDAKNRMNRGIRNTFKESIPECLDWKAINPTTASKLGEKCSHLGPKTLLKREAWLDMTRIDSDLLTLDVVLGVFLFFFSDI